jgi:membrane associated rhomboid family serine protease
MVALYMLGPPLEHMFGRVRFLVLYLVSAVGGAATSYLIIQPNALGLGASGAIFGLFGAMLVVSRRMHYDLRPILVVIGINAVIGFTFPNIDWRAHLGGLVTGALVALAMVYAPREHRTLVQVTGTLLVLVLIAAVVVGRTNALLG